MRQESLKTGLKSLKSRLRTAIITKADKYSIGKRRKICSCALSTRMDFPPFWLLRTVKIILHLLFIVFLLTFKVFQCIVQALYYKLIKRQVVFTSKFFELFNYFLRQAESLADCIITFLYFPHFYTPLFIQLYDTLRQK